MADEGLIDSAPGRAFHKSGGVPKVTVLRVVEADDSGNIFGGARAMARRGPAAAAARDRARPARRARHRRPHPRPDRGARAGLCRPPDEEARCAPPSWCSAWSRKEGERFWLTPVEKKERRELAISDLKDAEPGDLVLCEVSGRPPRVTARVDAVLGDPFAPRSFSLIAIHKHGLRHEFRQEAIDEAHRVAKQPLGEREDLTHLPIVAIDPADARDHDDAIWAAPDDDEDKGRLERDRRHRRRQLLRPPRLRARPRGAGARQQRLFPRPRRADAAGGIVGRHLLAEGRRRCARRWPAT